MRRLALPALALALLLTGCGSGAATVQNSLFAMDTVMSFTLNGEGDPQALQDTLGELGEIIHGLEDRMSATDEDSEIYALNHAQGQPVSLSPETAELLEQALELCRVTGGALDITAYPAVEAWGFPTGEYRVPGPEELDQLVGQIDYTRLEVDEADGTAVLPAGMEADLGAVAKGYAGDLLAEQLAEQGIDSALLNLGESTILAVGEKPEGTPWRIAVQDPAGEGYLGVLELRDRALGTSGGYQRYFESGGQTYWHIMDPATAAPARSGLAGVTVVSSSGLLCDGLSTALFVMGLEEGVQFWRDHQSLEFEVLFVTDEGELYLTPGLEDSFSLTEEYRDRGVTVLS